MRIGIAIAAVVILVSSPAWAEDAREPLTLPGDVRAGFLEEMRGHMESLDDVISAVAAGDFAGASQLARDELGVGSGKGYGRFMPVQFRQMGMAMHRSALDFADVAAAARPDSAEDWRRVATALANVSTNCRGCHATFRVQ